MGGTSGAGGTKKSKSREGGEFLQEGVGCISGGKDRGAGNTNGRKQKV